MRLAEKVAIITGAGSGIGREIAKRFAQEGAVLVIADMDGPAAAKVSDEIQSAGGKATSVCANISGEEGARTIAAAAVAFAGRADILVNNAASFVHKRVEDATSEDWQKVLGVNVVGTSLVSKHVVAEMKKSGGGAIVNIASINGLIATPDWMTYNSSKAAVIEMSKCMAMDLAPFNIRANCICPGVTHTPALENLFDEMSMSGKDVFDQFVAPHCLIKRYAAPDDIAYAAIYLASEEASYVTGATLVVDGGYTA